MAVFRARPQIFFTDHLSLAFEGGFDRVWSGQHLYNGWLRKFTIAPQIGAGREFFSRPVLRLFVTYGGWSDGVMGFVVPQGAVLLKVDLHGNAHVIWEQRGNTEPS